MPPYCSSDANAIQSLADFSLASSGCVNPVNMSSKRPRPAHDVSNSNSELFVDKECRHILERYGLYGTNANEITQEHCSAAPKPGFAGDGLLEQKCKICGNPENSTDTLICDVCDQSFHTICHQNVKDVPKDDQWICRFCKRKGKKLKCRDGFELFKDSRELRGDSNQAGRSVWKDEGRTRTRVRIGLRFQAEVLEWTGKMELDEKQDSFSSYYLENQVSLSMEDKAKEMKLAEENLNNNVWPKGWLPALSLPRGNKQNWLQCRCVLYEEGERGPDGKVAKENIICGKWRRAPLTVVATDGWECSCAVTWDPRHADCVVPQARI
ncbi:hypothetical protein O6H91_14G008400 [Diphasiastrum complanatum]|uniref:Uncharacterized protein n=1 Tax=Diphasiastrum complanatum TaxID=34168 RepID=A0ACC2BLC4_DIPCM|nr:hypothetical protein O6H91_14G008400 [Diphasiastrum complanatum]